MADDYFATSIAGASRCFLLVWKDGSRIGDGLQRFASENGISVASVSGIGAVSEVTFGFLDTEIPEYRKTTYAQPAEVISFLGNIVPDKDGTPVLHAHIAVAGADGIVHGGHFFDATAHPTLEVILTELGTGEVRRGGVHPTLGARLLEPTT